MTALRIEPVTQPEDPAGEYSLLDEQRTEVAVVTGKAWAKKFAVVEGLIEITLQFISECGECNHTGLVSRHIPGHDTVAAWDADDQPCPECTPARALLAQAGVVV
jgi:hypothetical protein